MKKKDSGSSACSGNGHEHDRSSGSSKKQKKRVKELPLFTELPDTVKKWEMQD